MCCRFFKRVRIRYDSHVDLQRFYRRKPVEEVPVVEVEVEKESFWNQCYTLCYMHSQSIDSLSGSSSHHNSKTGHRK